MEDCGNGRVRCLGGRLFSWGRGQCGQLGHGDVRTQPLPKEIKKGSLSARVGGVGGYGSVGGAAGRALGALGGTLGAGSYGGGSYGGVARGSSMQQAERSGVVSVGCGWNFTVVVHYDGAVSCWGKGGEGQLGSSSLDGGNVTRPTFLEDSMFGKMDEEGMIPWCPHTVGCGKAHTVVLCQRHPGSVMMAANLSAADMCRPTAVFSWGYGERGELGTQHALRPVPAQIKFPGLMPGDAIVSVTTGSLHCSAVTQFGSVYVWGCNRHGALGVEGSMDDVWVPVKVPLRSLMAASGERSARSSRSDLAEGSSDLITDGSVVYPVQVACGERCTIVLMDKCPSGRGPLATSNKHQETTDDDETAARGDSSISSSTSSSSLVLASSLPLPSSRPVEMQSSISMHCLGTTRRSSFIVGSGKRGSSLNVHQFGGFGDARSGEEEEEEQQHRSDSVGGGGQQKRRKHSSEQVYDTTQHHRLESLEDGSSLSTSSTRAHPSLSDHASEDGRVNSSGIGGVGGVGGDSGVGSGASGAAGAAAAGAAGGGNASGGVDGIQRISGRRHHKSMRSSSMRGSGDIALSENNFSGAATSRGSVGGVVGGVGRHQSSVSITDARLERDRIKNLRRDSKIWQQEILPRWERTHEAPSKKMLMQQCARLSTGGVPPHLRKRVWPLLIANALRITPELFEMYRDRARSRNWRRMEEEQDAAIAARGYDEEEDSDLSESPIRRRSSFTPTRRKRMSTSIGKEITLNLIDVDLPRTFPQLKLFDSTGPFHAKLKEVLETYACYRPDLGYVQGMSYIAALLCLYMSDTYQAFCCLANVMIDDNSHFFAFFNLSRTLSNQKNRPDAYYEIFNVALSEHSKSVHKKMLKLKENGLDPSVYLFNWLQTAYLRVLPLNVTSRVWDLFLIDGTPFLFRVGVALLVVFKQYLLGEEFEDCAKLLTNHPSKRSVWEEMMTEAALFKQIDTVSLSRGVKEKLARLISGSTR